MDIKEFYTSDLLSLTKEDVHILEKWQSYDENKFFDFQEIKQGKYRIKTNSYAGFIQLSNSRLDIKPKISNLSLFYLLSYASEIPIFDLPEAKFDQTEDTIQPFLKIIFLYIEKFMMFELRRGYFSHDAILRSPTGKILITENIRRLPNEYHNLVCEFDEFSYDILPNKILLYTVYLLYSMIKDEEYQLRINYLMRRFKHITLQEITVSIIDRLKLGRQFDHYKGVIGYCRIILSNLSLTEDKGEHRLTSFMINMNSLFEKFIFRWIETIFNDCRVTKPSLEIIGEVSELLLKQAYSNGELNKRIFKAVPDILVKKDNTTLFIGDAKYKILDTTSRYISNQSDMYQLLSYSILSKSNKAILFYPQTSKSIALDFNNIPSLEELRIRILFIPLGGDNLEELENQIKAIMKQTKEWILFS